MALREYADDEYEPLRRSERAVAGNTERAEVQSVSIVDTTAEFTVGFDWKPGTERIGYDLDAERDVMELKSVAEAAGSDYDQLPYLERETIPVVYLDDRWVPAAALPDGGPAALADTSPAVPSLADRAYDRLSDWSDGITAQSVVLAVVLGKKLLVVSALIYLLVT